MVSFILSCKIQKVVTTELGPKKALWCDNAVSVRSTECKFILLQVHGMPHVGAVSCRRVLFFGGLEHNVGSVCVVVRQKKSSAKRGVNDRTFSDLYLG